ncbi:PTS glucitol/sorbitol transporter subunit IIA [Salipaludibacillus agaradhaerens]|uniref:PTS glucitol/sorbitol transporter subunit IIA n=1 Tax=Salipaludibacillus agaradhaerens TaxID=76935 RepID=UPI002150F663|nr:PTS glucitol/sorbitol transporter subunit IIA [Salipaludibacillus agaradhaerens]MCR6105693.1 PTS glucitol/sorbitol transporter subunit IIA [Salipaludibacillus agaradhaerens]MCR6117730.1 PTS glucitol/sorbitol transporter subunit IIA [Salipaludibacillus agaradhaerens]UJW56904.1 PTS glucitol/sorbitol transporter subunit IIA [Bacillus sp. A116_S68]
MHTKYETHINKIGSSVTEFLDDKMLVLFGESAPAELIDYCLSITVNEIDSEIKAGDMLQIGDAKYKITSVGEAVETNLTSLGHITLKFDGLVRPELPGTLYLEDTEIQEVKQGDTLRIYSHA